jgi:hypothetical protein
VAKKGIRKCGVLIWEGDNLTRDDKKRLCILNDEKYGLSTEEVEAIKIPAASNVQIYDI